MLLDGVIGILIGLVFIDPKITPLFDKFWGVIGQFMGVLGGLFVGVLGGQFMGVLGGLFVLGALTRRANGNGAFLGGLVGAAVMFFHRERDRQLAIWPDLSYRLSR